MKFKNTTNIRGKKSQKYSIIIPSAGMGKRMRSYGPKSLIKITPEKNIVENHKYQVTMKIKQLVKLKVKMRAMQLHL